MKQLLPLLYSQLNSSFNQLKIYIFTHTVSGIWENNEWRWLFVHIETSDIFLFFKKTCHSVFEGKDIPLNYYHVFESGKIETLFSLWLYYNKTGGTCLFA